MLIVTGAIILTLVSPESQTAKIATAVGGVWNKSLENITPRK